jgi:hypothetical protein
MLQPSTFNYASCNHSKNLNRQQYARSWMVQEKSEPRLWRNPTTIRKQGRILVSLNSTFSFLCGSNSQTFEYYNSSILII